MCGRVENLSALVISQEVYALVNVLVETVHFVKGQSVSGIRLFSVLLLLVAFLALVIVIHVLLLRVLLMLHL